MKSSLMINPPHPPPPWKILGARLIWNLILGRHKYWKYVYFGIKHYSEFRNFCRHYLQRGL
jgi:hypothetical protein